MNSRHTLTHIITITNTTRSINTLAATTPTPFITFKLRHLRHGLGTGPGGPGARKGPEGPVRAGNGAFPLIRV